MVNMLGHINKDPFIFTTEKEILKKEILKGKREKEILKGKREKEILKRKKEDIKLKTEVYALSQSISMSAHKARRVLDQIRGRSYQETLMILELMPYRACYPIFKLIYSAAANAKHNMGLNEEYLVIIKAAVNEGATVKKLKPRARGRSYAIKRPTCHITIVLKDTALYEQYVVENSIRCLKKPGWIYKNKSTDITCHNMYSSGGVWDKK
uniref:ribosomal protein L22 n=1 Tax=Rhoicissus digitata TaxID=178808 RepID=UPI001FA79E24|nr:ribosomal protein L22 [Rhoicissus digitata]UNA63445.1 ribosomal protein L22 [Rhoicissus digitata]